MKKIFFGVIVSALLIACNNEKPAEEAASTSSDAKSASGDKKPATEVLDISEADGVKAGFAAFTKKDVEGMTANYDDNIRYHFSGGDSLVGKQATKDYWTGRMNIIDSINYSEQIVLPIKINKSQSPKYEVVGKWVLAWNFTHVKYKNGKTLHFWVHTDFHYNDAGKVDIVVQYVDRHPIFEATKDLMKK